MLQLSASLINRPVMSLRTGGMVATTEELIINPNNLKIEGIYCIDHFSKERLVLLPQDIRDILREGFVINDHEVLTEESELIRLKPIIELAFVLAGKSVQTEKKQRLGKVVDFAVDDQTLYVQKLYVGHSILKSFSNSQLSIDRNQIVEITNRRIVIKEIQKPAKVNVSVVAPAV